MELRTKGRKAEDVSEAEIERIVQEVIRRLTSAGIRVSSGNSELKLSDRIVTLATIEGRLDGVQQLVVPAKAVVTPSVNDELRDRNIELVRQSS